MRRRISAGSIEFAVVGDAVTILSLSLDDGWQETSRDESDDDVELDLQRDGARIELDADVDDGTLEVDIDTSTVAAGTYVEPTLGGDVALTVADDAIAIESITPAEGWEVDDQEQSSSSVDIDLIDTTSARTVDVSAEVDDDELEIETDTRIAVAT